MEVVFEVDIQNLMTPMYMKNAWFLKSINTNIGFIRRWVNDICVEMVIKIVHHAVTKRTQFTTKHKYVINPPKNRMKSI